MDPVDTTFHGGPIMFYIVAFIHTHFFSLVLVLALLGFLIITAHKSVFVVTKALPVSHSVISCFANKVHVVGHGLALLTRHFYPAPCCPFLRGDTVWRVLPHQMWQHLEACLVLAASIAPILSPQGIGGTYPASDMQNAALTAMLLSQRISLVSIVWKWERALPAEKGSCHPLKAF